MQGAASTRSGSEVPLIRDPSRVAELGEVFTPTWLVRRILELVPEPELERLDSKCLDPACGHGQFLVEVLRAKLALATGSASDGEEYRFAALTGLASAYGVDIDGRNVREARQRLAGLLLDAHRDALGEAPPDAYGRAADFVLERNLVRADFLHDDFPVTEFLPSGSPGCFELTTTMFSSQLPVGDPRRLPLLAEAPVTEGPLHWRQFGRETGG